MLRNLLTRYFIYLSYISLILGKYKADDERNPSTLTPALFIWFIIGIPFYQKYNLPGPTAVGISSSAAGINILLLLLNKSALKDARKHLRSISKLRLKKEKEQAGISLIIIGIIYGSAVFYYLNPFLFS